MKKISLFVCITSLLLMLAGCAANEASNTEPVPEASEEKTSGNEAQGAARYKSLIDKYVGKAGMGYKAYDEIMKWDGRHGTAACMHSAEEWLGSDGRLRPPFDCDEVMREGATAYAHFYVPDELAVKASTDELTDICLRYSAMYTLFSLNDIEYSCFELMVRHSNAMEESLRRDDFAGEYFERYMRYSQNPKEVPEYFENAEDGYSVYDERKNILNFIEIVLAQAEAYEQLTEQEREQLVREAAKNGKASRKSFFFACITGEYYMSDKSGECIWGKNPWLETIDSMEFTEEEQGVLKEYF
ncbi:MAG: hypothetical protein NC223_00305 [Butyrivibrio sp.]|nr:hypothetical protein [Butyrivibrio sp.]